MTKRSVGGKGPILVQNGPTRPIRKLDPPLEEGLVLADAGLWLRKEKKI